MSEPATHLSCLTPAGSGAIAVLALRGPQAWPVLRALFRPASGKPLPDDIPPPGTVLFGRLGEGELTDEVVLTVKQLAPQPWLELHTHGGRQVVDWLEELLTSRGLTRCSGPEFLALIEPPQRVLALNQFARVATARTASILLDQVHGAFDTVQTAAQAQAALKYAKLGQHLAQPWRVVIAGPPNAGKSTLLNALAGFQRSIVAPVAGTTRDVVSVLVAIDGWPVELIDTAGLRTGAAGLEGAGIEQAQSAMENADLVIWLFDAQEAPPPAPDHPNLLRVANKCDLAPAPEDADLRISALQGTGLGELCAVISRKLVAEPPPPGAAIPISVEQIALLEQISHRPPTLS